MEMGIEPGECGIHETSISRRGEWSAVSMLLRGKMKTNEDEI